MVADVGGLADEGILLATILTPEFLSQTDFNAMSARIENAKNLRFEFNITFHH